MKPVHWRKGLILKSFNRRTQEKGKKKEANGKIQSGRIPLKKKKKTSKRNLEKVRNKVNVQLERERERE